MGVQRDRKAYGCVIRNNLKRLRQLLGKHPELSTSNDAWIVAAAVLNNPGILGWLISRGVNPDSRLGTESDTPLMLAISLHKNSTVKTLLRLGADPNARDDLGDTCFTRAIVECNAPAMRMLADSGADLSLTDPVTLRYAVNEKQTDVIDGLLDLFGPTLLTRIESFE